MLHKFGDGVCTDCYGLRRSLIDCGDFVPIYDRDESNPPGIAAEMLKNSRP